MEKWGENANTLLISLNGLTANSHTIGSRGGSVNLPVLSQSTLILSKITQFCMGFKKQIPNKQQNDKIPVQLTPASPVQQLLAC